MDPKIRKLYTEDILSAICNRFDIEKDTLEELDGFESYIYSFEKDGKGYILRVSHSIHRDADAVQGEAEFIDYLGANGINVGRPVRDSSGKLVEAIPAKEGIFSAVVFEKVPGKETKREDWQNSGIMKKLGRMLGKMHRLTKSFEPSEDRYRRLNWEQDNEIVYGFIENGLPADEAQLVKEKYQKLVEEVRALPKDQDNYGLVHFDVHGGNFFLDQGEIHLFDFDDCMYTWFANDIAMVIYYGTYGFRDNPEELRFQLKQFFVGYAEENEINPAWLDYIPAFLMLRRLSLYALVHNDIPREEWDIWCENLVKTTKEQFQTGAPILPVDISTLLD